MALLFSAARCRFRSGVGSRRSGDLEARATRQRGLNGIPRIHRIHGRGHLVGVRRTRLVHRMYGATGVGSCRHAASSRPASPSLCRATAAAALNSPGSRGQVPWRLDSHRRTPLWKHQHGKMEKSGETIYNYQKVAMYIKASGGSFQMFSCNQSRSQLGVICQLPPL